MKKNTDSKDIITVLADVVIGLGDTTVYTVNKIWQNCGNNRGSYPSNCIYSVIVYAVLPWYTV